MRDPQYFGDHDAEGVARGMKFAAAIVRRLHSRKAAAKILSEQKRLMKKWGLWL